MSNSNFLAMSESAAVTAKAVKETKSYKVAKVHGISISAATYIANNYFSIQNSDRNLFRTYYILAWQASYFQEKLQQGTIEREGITYQVIYHRTNPAEITQLVEMGGHLKLSFRSLLADFGVQPTVLVALDAPLTAQSYKPHTSHTSQNHRITHSYKNKETNHE